MISMIDLRIVYIYCYWDSLQSDLIILWFNVSTQGEIGDS